MHDSPYGETACVNMNCPFLKHALRQIAQRRNATSAQVALAWLLAQKSWIVPIPGTTKIHRLEENIGSASLQLTREDIDEINSAASKTPILGERLPESILKMSYR